MKVTLPERVAAVTDALFVLEIEFPEPRAQPEKVTVTTVGDIEARDLRGTGVGGSYDVHPGLQALHIPLRVVEPNSGEARVAVEWTDGDGRVTAAERTLQLEAPAAGEASGSGAKLAVVGVLLAALAAIGFFVVPGLFGSDTIPRVAGKTLAEASKLLEDAGYKVTVEEVPVENRARNGIVLRTDPTGGNKRKQGAEVEIQVGSLYVSVSDATGQSERNAAAALEGQGLQPIIKYADAESSREVGIVMEQSPSTGERVPLGESVTILVGREPRGGFEGPTPGPGPGPAPTDPVGVPPIPGPDVPGPDVPAPGPDVPGPDVPAPGPDVPAPGPDVPGPDVPGPDVPVPGPDVPAPGPDVPGPDVPGPDVPGPDVPAPGPDVPAPGPDVPAPGPDVPQPADPDTRPEPPVPPPVKPDPPQPPVRPELPPVRANEVPAVVGQTRALAQTLVRRAGLRYRVRLVETQDQPDGTVLRQEPAAGKSMAITERVILFVAKRPPTAGVSVPNVVGSSYADAARTLRKAGFLVRREKGSGSGTKVVAQDPPAGAEAPARSWVLLTLGS